MNCRELWLAMLCAGALASACAPAPRPSVDPWQPLRQDDGSVRWLDEYQFTPPPAPWQVVDLNEADASLALFKSCAGQEPGVSPCESAIGYAEEPFGHSREFEPRAHEFLRRYLWAARVSFAVPELTRTTISGREALVVRVNGEEPVKRHRLQAKIVFLHRGERVVAFFSNQWRSGDTPFSVEDFADFDRFVASFRFVRPSFYETLQTDHSGQQPSP
jgi:hypothetical protein